MEPVTAFILALAAALTPISVIVGYFRTKKRAKQTEQRVEQVHILVNSKMSDALDRIRALEEQLRQAKVDAIDARLELDQVNSGLDPGATLGQK